MSNTIEVFNKKTLVRDLKIEAKALGIPMGAAEIFIDKTVDGVAKKLEKKKIITKRDLERATVVELKKYNADLAYVYEIRDKII